MVRLRLSNVYSFKDEMMKICQWFWQNIDLFDDVWKVPKTKTIIKNLMLFLSDTMFCRCFWKMIGINVFVNVPEIQNIVHMMHLREVSKERGPFIHGWQEGRYHSCFVEKFKISKINGKTILTLLRPFRAPERKSYRKRTGIFLAKLV